MAIVAQYTFKHFNSIDIMPKFNDDFIGYTIEDTLDETNAEQAEWTTSRTISHDTLLPTQISFDLSDNADNASMINSLKSIEFLDVSKITTMNSMFKSCCGLETITGIEDWDTSNIKNMSSCFCDCSSLKTLNLNNWNTSNVTNMSNIFNNCIALEEINVSNWNVSKVEDFTGAFNKCSSLKQLNLSKWNMIIPEDFSGVIFSDLDLSMLYLTACPLNSVKIIMNEFINFSMPTEQMIVEINAGFLSELKYIDNPKIIFTGGVGEQLAPKEKSNYFGIFEAMEQFYVHGYPKVEGYFAIMDIVYYYNKNKEINKIIDNIFLGKKNTLEEVPSEGYCELYGDLYYRASDERVAYLKGVRYGDTAYHVLALDGWTAICDSINILKDANDGTLDDSLVDADHTFTSLKLKEKFQELIDLCKEKVDEAQKEKTTASLVDNCPTISKMIDNHMYFVPVYKNENEVAYYERYIKLEDTKHYLGEWGHSTKDYYLKEVADSKYGKANVITSDGNLGLTSNIIYKVFNGETRVNKRTVCTTVEPNSKTTIKEIDNDFFTGQIKTRIINGFQEVVFELKSKGGTYTYANTDTFHGGTVELTDVFKVPTVDDGNNLADQVYVNGYMRVIDYPEDQLEEGQKPPKYGCCFINGDVLYIVADLNHADVIYSGYLIYPVWGNEVI